MKRVLTAVILIPVVTLALFKAPLWLFTLLVLGVALLAAREYFDIAEKTGFRPMRGWGYFALTVVFAAMAVGMDKNLIERTGPTTYGITWVPASVAAMASVAAILLLFWPYILLACSMVRDPLSQSLPDAAISMLVLPYIGISFAAMVFVRADTNGSLYLLFLMLLVWCGDIAAYYVGRTIGKHKLAPRVSPGKTWEGAAASIVGAVAVGLLLFHYINPIASGFRGAHLLTNRGPLYSALSDEPRRLPIAPWWFAGVFAVCVNIAAQLGDLVESALKRGAGMKDSGTLLPGHGGVLDRIDALLFALPVGLLFYAFGMSRYFEPLR